MKMVFINMYQLYIFRMHPFFCAHAEEVLSPENRLLPFQNGPLSAESFQDWVDAIQTDPLKLIVLDVV